jgi:predicted ribosomally synthesized peptide with SipW-like signal peptide
MRGKGGIGKIGAVFLVLAICLAGTGAAYAHWSQTLVIDGTVETGSVCVGFTELTCVEKHVDPATGLKVDGEWGGKDVGQVECSLEGLKGTPPNVGYERIVCTITNSYPSHQVHIIFAIKNLGTIPVHFTEMVISDPTGELIWEPVPQPAPIDGFLWKDFNGNGTYEVGEEVINVDIKNLISLQLHPGEDTKAEVDVHLKQAAEQGHTYSLLAEIVAIQWNMD